ncbi:MAG TPA: hypothetical protein VI413_03235, partial [Paludibacter sp.]
MKKRIVTIVFLLSLLSWSGSAQVAMGKWRTHFAYNSVSQIAQSDNKIYAVSEGALFSVDKQDGEGGIEFYSKISGLNGSNISRIEFDPTSKQLLIIYTNGNIDLLTTGGVINIPDLYNKQMSSSKEVNHIQFYQDKAYLSCNFGIIVLNMQKKEVADTYYIGPNASEVKVLSTVVHNGTIYALTPNTIFKASVSEPNLVNYAFWSTVNALPGIGDLQSISSFSDQLILQRAGKLYKQGSDNLWDPFLSNINVSNFNVTNESLNVFDGSAAYLVDKQFNVKTVSNIGILSDAEYDKTNNTYWFAANALGVISYKQNGSEEPTLSYYKPEGPAVNIPSNMIFSGKKLFVVSGGHTSIFSDQPGNVMMYENNVWTNIYSSSIESKTGIICRDLMSIAVDSSDNKHFFATSARSGLYEFNNNEFSTYHNFTNSTIENIMNDYQYQVLGGSVFDKSGNLWLTNCFVRDIVKVMLKDGSWTQL